MAETRRKPRKTKDCKDWPGASSRIAVFIVVFLLVGCVTVPPPSGVEQTSAAELAAHVKFLAQPRLQGRKPGTYGSRVAREYIASHFRAYGLVPWGSAEKYEQSFGYGKNVVGMLPGSDANLAGEIVLVSAHYDHLGKHKGKVSPGAADNASGVAVLLETAKRLSRARPKRTVAFAAFDCEERMLFGSFAFACRPDVDKARISAVVNMDMLGRDLLDAVQNAVFVAGAERYPEIREEVRGFGTNASIRIFPIGSDLIGPRSDHVAFETRDIPCLFFSCGTFKDYHQPGDTPAKLNYEAVERSANVILRTVRNLGDRSEIVMRDDTDFYAEELRTVSTVLSEVVASIERRNDEEAEGASGLNLPNAGGLDPSLSELAAKLDLANFRGLQRSAEDLLRSGRYDREARERLAVEATGILAPYVLPVGGRSEAGPEQEESVMNIKLLQLFYLNYRREILAGYRQLASQVLKYRPGVFRSMPPFVYEVYDIADRDVSVVETGQNNYALSALLHRFTLKSGSQPSKWLLKSFGLEFSFAVEAMDCSGTRDQVIDFWLLRARRQQTNELRMTKLKKVLRVVTGTDSAGSYHELIQERLSRGGFKDETEWIVSCLQSGNADLTLAAIRAAWKSEDELCGEALRRLVINRKSRPDVRAAAIESVAGNDRRTLTMLCDLLDDTNLIHQPEFISRLREGYPFANREMVRIQKPMIEKQMQRSSDAGETIGDLALEKLKKATRQDFALDSPRWREWVETHVR